jgi:20S proteasome alpha/beta subunit
MDSYENATPEQLIAHAIAAMKKAQDVEITQYNIAVSIVGKDQEFKILTPEELSSYFDNTQKMDVI